MLKDEYVKFKNYERKVKSPFMIYVDFEIIFSARRRWKTKSKKSLIRISIRNMLVVVMAIK